MLRKPKEFTVHKPLTAVTREEVLELMQARTNAIATHLCSQVCVCM